MSDDKDVTFCMKVVINKQKTKVLFAEIDNDLADVLLSFLTLPLGQIVRLLKKHYGDEAAPAVGSLTTLYNGLANLSCVHFLTEGCKDMILNPRSSFEAQCRKLKVDIRDAQPTKFFTCEDLKCVHKQSYISILYDVARCPCGKSTLKKEIEIDMIDDDYVAADVDNGVFTKKRASFVISDNLMMVPNVAVSIMETHNGLGIRDIAGAELRTATIGFNEIMDLLKGSLLSRTPLTDLILEKTNISTAARVYSNPITEKDAFSSNSKKMSLKLMVQECNNKLLFAQAGEDFVDFLCTLLTIPLAGAQCLLGRNYTGLQGVDNLRWSVAHHINDKYFASKIIKPMLMKPKLPHGYLPKNQILPLAEYSGPEFYFDPDAQSDKGCLSYTSGNDRWVPGIKGDGTYVKGPTTYMVTDDLTVTPLTLTSSVLFMNELRIPLSEVKEVDMKIGLEEAIGILRASLTSTYALSNGLMINSMLKKQTQRKRKAESESKTSLKFTAAPTDGRLKKENI